MCGGEALQQFPGCASDSDRLAEVLLSCERLSFLRGLHRDVNVNSEDDLAVYIYIYIYIYICRCSAGTLGRSLLAVFCNHVVVVLVPVCIYVCVYMHIHIHLHLHIHIHIHVHIYMYIYIYICDVVVLVWGARRAKDFLKSQRHARKQTRPGPPDVKNAQGNEKVAADEAEDEGNSVRCSQQRCHGCARVRVTVTGEAPEGREHRIGHRPELGLQTQVLELCIVPDEDRRETSNNVQNEKQEQEGQH